MEITTKSNKTYRVNSKLEFDISCLKDDCITVEKNDLQFFKNTIDKLTIYNLNFVPDFEINKNLNIGGFQIYKNCDNHAIFINGYHLPYSVITSIRTILEKDLIETVLDSNIIEKYKQYLIGVLSAVLKEKQDKLSQQFMLLNEFEKNL